MHHGNVTNDINETPRMPLHLVMKSEKINFTIFTWSAGSEKFGFAQKEGLKNSTYRNRCYT